MKKTIIFIALVIVAIVCWNWMLESRTLVSALCFFGMFIGGVFAMPVESEKKV